MKTILIAITLSFAATLANGQFSCTPKVSSDICKAAGSGNIVGFVQKGLTVVVADPASFTLEKSQLESAAKVRCEAAVKTGIAKVMNGCSGQPVLGIDSNAVLLETSPDGSLQKIIVSTDFFRAADKTKAKLINQPDGNAKVEVGYAEPDPLTTFENMTRVGFFVMGYNSGRLNYIADNL